MANTTLPRTGNRQADEIIDRAERSIRALEQNPLAQAVFVPVTFTAAYPATVRVYHGLGRPARGYFVVNTPNAFGFLTEVPPTSEPEPANYITLAYGSAAVALIAIF